MFCDTFHFCCRYNCTSCRKYTVDCTKFFAGTFRIWSHTTFTDNDSDTSLFCEFIFEFFHTHGSSRSYRYHLIVILSSFDFTNDWACMENSFVANIIWKFSSIFHQTAVCYVTAGHQISVQPYNISDFNIFQILCTDRGNKNFFISSNFDHDFFLLLCIEFPCGMCITGYSQVRIHYDVSTTV